MKALTFEGIHQISYTTIPDPEILSPDEVIVQVKMAGICGSDLHIYHGRETGLDCGTAMGHEFVGEVVAIGKSVKQFRTGDMVFSPFTTSCGMCYFCQIGMTCRCEKGHIYGWVEQGRGLDGGQAEFVRVPLADSTLLPLSSDLSMEQGLLLGDIFSTGYFCADMAGIEPNGVYVVLGCGPVGLMAIMSAFDLGATTVYAVDAIAARLEMAQKLGAKPLHLNDTNLKPALLAATNGRGADAVLEVVGSMAASRLAMDLVRPCGTISTVGVHTTPSFAFSPVEAYNKNLTFKIGRCPARFYAEKLIRNEAVHRHDVASIITHRFALSEGEKAYRIFDKKQENCLKAVLEMK